MFQVINAKYNLNMDSHKSLEDLFLFAKERNMTSIGICENGTMRSALDIFLQAKEKNIRVMFSSIFSFKVKNNIVNLALYPKNNFGFKQLKKLSSEYSEQDNTEFDWSKTTKEFLKNFLVVLDSHSLINVRVLTDVISEILKKVEVQDFYVGLKDGIEGDYKEFNLELEQSLESLKSIYKEKCTHIKYVVFNELLYWEEEDEELSKVLLSIKKKDMDSSIDYSLVDVKEAMDLFSYLKNKPSNSEFERKISITSEFGEKKNRIPSFTKNMNIIPSALFIEKFKDFYDKNKEKNFDLVKSAAYLFAQTMRGMLYRYGKDTSVAARILMELDVIINKNFADYFLIVQDIILNAKRNGLLVGPGRGSVTGSVVAYCLGIHEMCPFKYGLQFERFLNPYRDELPDIDIDVSQKSRNKVIEYMKERYGIDNVVQMSSIQPYGLKKSIDYVVDALELPKILKTELIEVYEKYEIDNFETFEDLIINGKPELVDFVLSNKDIEQVLEYAFVIKTIPNAVPRHPAGVIISTTPIKEELPVMWVGKKGKKVMVSQISNDNNKLEKIAGYLKFDVLGIRNLDVLEECKVFVEKRTGHPFPKIPLDDAKTFETYKKGDTIGIFQMESPGMRETSKKFAPSTFEEIITLIAMYRPGPMELIDTFIAQKGKEFKVYNNKGEELKEVEDLKSILTETNGVIVYQEQINRLVQVWAGYTLGEAELFRKAVSKKKSDLLSSEKETFIEKAVKNGRSKETSEDLFELILKFANYGFNKSHATAYAWLSYQMTYLKTHYPLEFMSALLSSVVSKTDRCGAYIEEARRMGLQIQKPDINKSSVLFEPNGNVIRFGLAMIKDMGISDAENVVNLRNNKPFVNMQDFLTRAKNSKVNQGVIKSLGKVGTFDSLIPREDLLKTNEFTLTFSEKVLLEVDKLGTVFCIDDKQKTSLLKQIQGKGNCCVGLVIKVIEMKDRKQRDMAKLDFFNFEGERETLVIFNYDWLKMKSQIQENEFYIFNTKDKTIVKKALKVNIGKN